MLSISVASRCSPACATYTRELQYGRHKRETRISRIARIHSDHGDPVYRRDPRDPRLSMIRVIRVYRLSGVYTDRRGINNMQVGVNYPWFDYGWDFGLGPPAWRGGRQTPRWFDKVDEHLTHLHAGHQRRALVSSWPTA